MLSWNYVACGKKKSRFIKNQEARKIQLNWFVSITFAMVSLKWIKLLRNFHWIKKKLCPNLIKQLGFTYSACGLFIKHCERIQKIRETGSLTHVCINELDGPCFAYDAAYFDNEKLTKRSISDKKLKDKVYKDSINSKYDGYQRELAFMVYKFFDKKKEVGIKAN